MYKNIPDELRKLDRWVCWKLEERDGKLTKVPYNPMSSGRAMSNNPATWGTFEDALKSVETGSYNGIGFMFSGDGILGVDIDHCKDPDTGELTDQVKDIIDTLDSYTEYSQSGAGIHIICRGKLPEGKRRKGSVEMYEVGRYFVMTGNVLDDAHCDIEDRTEELQNIHKKYLSDNKTVKNVAKITKSVLKPIDFDLNDDEILNRAMAASNGDLFKDLYNGSWSGRYGSQSQADIGFCNLLAFWFGRDEVRMNNTFRRSGLWREKWEEKRGERTYGEMTIAKSAADCTRVYEPRQYNSSRVEVPEGYTKSPVETIKEFSDTTSDLGRSKIFSSKHKGQLLWCRETKEWLSWNGKRWESGAEIIVMQRAKDLIPELIRQAGELVSNAVGEDEMKRAKAIHRDTVKGKSEKAIKSMVELTKSDIPVSTSQLDSDPFLMNCQNGVIDLRTGELLPHKADLYMTQIAKANYVPGKKFELFGEFMKLITCGDAESAIYFQQICGMAAIGKVFHEGIAMFYGGGQNGKSTFLNCVSKIFGDYACSINPEMLMSQRDGKQPVGITRLDGKRFVVAMESEEGRRLSAAMLKQLASTDLITGREMYQKERSFAPTHTLIMATNHLPKIGSTDTGTWRRIAVVPFKASIEGTKQIKDYAGILAATDGDAILSWIVDGARIFIANNYQLKVPQSVQEATKLYRASEDWINNFLQECCEKGKDFEESGGRLFDAYKKWCEENNESYVRRSRDFADELERQGFDKRRTMRGSIWIGLKIVNSSDSSDCGWTRYGSKKTKKEDETPAYQASWKM